MTIWLQIDFVVCVFVKLLEIFSEIVCVGLFVCRVWDAWIGCDSSKQTQEGNDDSADKKSCSIPLLEVTIQRQYRRQGDTN